MKKLYSLVAIAAISTGAFAQGSETFTNLNASSTSYVNGSYAGDGNITWTYNGARKATGSDAISGTSIGFGQSPDTRTLKAQSGAAGIGTLSYSVRSYFTGGVAGDRTIEVWVNNEKKESFTLTAMSTTFKRSLSLEIPNDASIEFRSTGTRQLVLDDISWTAKTLAVINADAKKVNFIKNTVVDQAILFGTDADVKIYSVSGQLVKSIAVKEGQSVDASNLAKGIYIVAGEFDGQKVTKKIIKK